jgi:hypothetical protein
MEKAGFEPGSLAMQDIALPTRPSRTEINFEAFFICSGFGLIQKYFFKGRDKSTPAVNVSTNVPTLPTLPT